MEPRGQNWNEQWPQNQISDHRVRDEQYRFQHSGKQGYYPSPNVRDSERQGFAPDPRYMYYMNGPPPPPPPPPPAEFSTAYSNQTYTPDRTRSQSRQGYDYPTHSYWDYRNDYSYYDNSYYRSYYGYPAAPDASGWPVQGWRPKGHQEWPGSTYTPQHGYEVRRDSGQYEGGVSVRETIDTGNETGEVSEPGGLASCKTSGLSSSTYELSQYINGDEQSNVPPPAYSEPEPDCKSGVPLKFSVPHVAFSFGPAGQLVRVIPALPSHGEPAQVELHSLEIILSETREQSEMRRFPGPLAREDLHKVDVINFALQMADSCLKNQTTFMPPSASLLWHLLVLLCRQNGRIVGSDIAELLLQGRRTEGACDVDGEQSDVGSLIDLNETPKVEAESFNTSDLLTGNMPSSKETSEQNIQNYTKLLLAGRKKEALESAMTSGLWGHALFLASKMNSRAYNTVLSRFTGSLSLSDPLQTLFQFLSGRIPAVATSYSKEKWGDWRPHLAVMLSNETGDSAIHCKSIINLGDMLATRGLLHAAHICYLMAHTPFGWYTNKAQHLVLLSSNHNASFADFCQNSAIRCTEVFEYCQRLGNPSFIIPSFLVYKFIYACRLLDCGLFSQAFYYCELVAKDLLIIKEPPIILLQEVIKMVDRLKVSETQISETGTDPDWVLFLWQRLKDLQMADSASDGLYCSTAKATVRTRRETEECGDLDQEMLSISEKIHTSLTENSHNDSVNVNSDQSTAHSYLPYLTEEQSYFTYSPAELSYHSKDQSYIPETQTCPLDEQPPRIYAPVPMYSNQNMVSSKLPPVPAVQDMVSHPDTYCQTDSGLDSRGHNNTDTDSSSGQYIMEASKNETAFGSADQHMMTPTEPNLKKSQKSEKESKSGWFSGWFRSKPKETSEDQYEQTEPTLMDSAPIHTFPTPPKVSPTMLPLQTQAGSVNPFSRRAGQKPVVAMSQGP